MNTQELAATAHAMVANHRGLLAADESTSTITKRFNSIKLESTEESRRSYREMLFTAPAATDSISGVILYDETIRQKTKDGVPFPAYLNQNKMIPGIKVDTGAKPLAGFPGETITEGLDGLRERLNEYYSLGARFAKWRAVIDIGAGVPTDYAIDANAAALARYAALCQEASIVPIVEPEVLMDGSHTLAQCEDVTNTVLDRVFSHLYAARVFLEGIVLKPNMIIPGKKCTEKATPQSPTEATLHLSLMNAAGPLPWHLTFSYGRALQEDALAAWGGKPGQFAAGQKAFSQRAKLNGLAAGGTYQSSMEKSAA